MSDPVQIVDQYETVRDAIEALHAQRNAMTAQLRLIGPRCAHAENALAEARDVADVEKRRGDLMMKERDEAREELKKFAAASTETHVSLSKVAEEVIEQRNAALVEIERLKVERQEWAKAAQKNDEDAHSLICEVAIKEGAIADRDEEIARLRADLANAIVPRVVAASEVVDGTLSLCDDGYAWLGEAAPFGHVVLLLTPDQRAYWVAKLKEAK